VFLSLLRTLRYILRRSALSTTPTPIPYVKDTHESPVYSISRLSNRYLTAPFAIFLSKSLPRISGHRTSTLKVSLMEPPTVPHVNLPPRRHRPQQQTRGVDVSASASSGSMSQPSHTGTHRLAPYSTVGQFSLAPTTQTTVVTTTTTTTTSFPQLLMRPPRNLNELDPKEFPLAAVPTPSNLKRFCFDLNGKPTHFRETDDPEQSLREVRSGIPAQTSDQK